VTASGTPKGAGVAQVRSRIGPATRGLPYILSEVGSGVVGRRSGSRFRVAYLRVLATGRAFATFRCSRPGRGGTGFARQFCQEFAHVAEKRLPRMGRRMTQRVAVRCRRPFGEAVTDIEGSPSLRSEEARSRNCDRGGPWETAAQGHASRPGALSPSDHPAARGALAFRQAADDGLLDV